MEVGHGRRAGAREGSTDAVQLGRPGSGVAQARRVSYSPAGSGEAVDFPVDSDALGVAAEAAAGENARITAAQT